MKQWRPKRWMKWKCNVLCGFPSSIGTIISIILFRALNVLFLLLYREKPDKPEFPCRQVQEGGRYPTVSKWQQKWLRNYWRKIRILAIDNWKMPWKVNTFESRAPTAKRNNKNNFTSNTLKYTKKVRYFASLVWTLRKSSKHKFTSQIWRSPICTEK